MTAENTQEIECLRKEIDAVDREIVGCIVRRSQLAQSVGKAKGTAPVYRPEREREVVERALAENRRLGGLLPDSVLSTLYLEIVSACRALEARPSVAYLGPQGTFTEMAVLKQFGSNIEARPCESIDEVFHSAESDRTLYAVVPVENSSQGTVTRTMDLLFSSPLSIIGEVHIPIAHNLMNFTGKKEDIEVVSAHPQALAQCRAWLGTHLPGVKTIPAASNAEAALEASKNPKMAAIAATRAAELYGLQIVSAGIQDDPRNRTRFLVLGHAVAAKGSAGSDKTSVVFSVPNRAGQLFHALEPLEKNGVSMMRLESRPARNGAWDYNFFVDVEGHATDAKVAQALAEMKEVSSFFKVLGSYPQAKDY